MIAPAAVDRETLIADPGGAFARNYNRTPFVFEHGLAGHPLFEIPNLVQLSRQLPDGGASAYWSNGRVDVTASWEANRAARYSLSDTIANIAENDSLVIIKHIEQDPQYGPLLRAFLDRVVALSGPAMERDVVAKEALILISSPHRITPYHFDAETNFVVQLTGSKTFRVWDHADRTLVTERELERFHAGDFSAAVFDPQREAKALRLDLGAGWAVHVPPHAPHAAQVHDNVSVALSINYELRSVQRDSDVWWMNHRLRSLGLRPVPPRRSAWRDAAKIAAVRTARTLLRRRRPTA